MMMTTLPIHPLARAGLGLERSGKVLLRPHDPRWAEAFEQEAARLLAAIGGASVGLHHVGSTAIPGIRAKPILDLLLVASSVDDLDAVRGAMEGLGYAWKGEYGIPGRRYAVLYDASKSTAFVHVHGYARGHPEVDRHLAFRDYLRSRADRAKEYERLKTTLAEDPAVTRSRYSEAKAPLLRTILAEAERWAASR